MRCFDTHNRLQRLIAILFFFFVNLDDYIFKSGIILELLPFIPPVAGCENTWFANRANVKRNSSRGNKHKLDNVI